MTVVVSAAFYNPHRGTCGCICVYCDGYSSPQALADPFSVAVNGNTQLQMQMTYYNGTVDTFTSSASWSSSDTSIATVGNGSTAGLTKGVSAGAMYMYASLAGIPTTTGEVCDPSGECPSGDPEGSAGGSVQQPAYVGVASPPTTGSVSCTGGGSARYLQTYYQVLDSSKSPINIAGMSVAEQLSWTGGGVCTTSNACGQEPTPATWTTGGTGTITQPDTIVNCSATCVHGGSCAEDWQQKFTVNGTSVGIVNGSTVGTLNCITTSCTSSPQGVTH